MKLRKVDIGDWSSPVARQHDVRRLPRLLLYDGERLVSSSTEEVLELLESGR